MESSSSWVVAQIGARMHYAVPRILAGHRMLHQFYTDVYSGSPFVKYLRFLPEPLRVDGIQRLLERYPEDIPDARIQSFPLFGFQYALRIARASTGKALQEAYLWGGQQFDQKVIREGLGKSDAVYVFNTAGLEIMQHANQQGKTTVMEQTIAPLAVERDLVREERRCHGDWVQAGDSPEKDKFTDEMISREQAEWEEADTILCGSEFVIEGIGKCGGPTEKCQVVPYGIPLTDRSDTEERDYPADRPLRVLTVGTVGLRKGIPYVLKAAQKLQDRARFRVVGPLDITDRAANMLHEGVQVVGPVPRTEVETQYRWADIFLLPSICEGSATVCYEALAHGLPVITTPNAGSIVRDQRDGFIVPVRDPDAIVECLVQLDEDRPRLASMSSSARQRSEKGSFEAYASRLLAALSPS